jgi:hypothetical protein
MHWPDLNPLFSWLRSAYSESDGTGSSTRVHVGLIIAFTVGVGVSFAVSVHHKLISLGDFDAFLGAAAAFTTATCGALYGINKLGSWAESKTQTPPQAGN